MSKRVFTCEPGRVIALNGKPLVAIHIIRDEVGERNISPVEATDLAHRIARLLNESEGSES